MGFLHPLEPAVFKKRKGTHRSASWRPGGLTSTEVSGKRVLRELSGHPIWASARNKDPKPKELVCDYSPNVMP